MRTAGDPIGLLHAVGPSRQGENRLAGWPRLSVVQFDSIRVAGTQENRMEPRNRRRGKPRQPPTATASTPVVRYPGKASQSVRANPRDVASTRRTRRPIPASTSASVTSSRRISSSSLKATEGIRTTSPRRARS